MYKTKISALIALLVIGLVISATPVVTASPLDIRPMIFVHGFSGSGAQFESQAMRFTSNGYPANYIATYEYNSFALFLNPGLISQVLAGLNNFIDTLRTQTGFAQVDLIGHSMGTRVCQEYLNSWPEGATKVANYVNIDGATASGPPGEVPTLAIWGMGHGDLEIVEATNVYFLDQSHVQVCTSAESFVEMYKFFTGEEPVTTRILPEPPSDVVLAGRALYFIVNIPVQGAVLNIWQVDGNTGARIYSSPEATYALPIGGDGSWGPFNANGGVHYEFALTYATALGMMTVHYYYQPFIRSDYLIRLLTDPPEGGLAQYMMTWSSNTHSNLIFIRYKEFWGDQVDNDILAINGTNVVNAGTCPISKSANAIYCFDEYNDTVSNIYAPVSFYYGLPFLTGVDLYIPAAIPPNGTTSIVLTPRGGGGRVQPINVPNWGSTNDVIVVQFNDYVQDVRMLIGLGGLRIDRNWYCGETTIYIINATVIDFRVDGVRMAWNIVNHRTYRSLESYKGEGELGWITILITKVCSVAYGHNVFFLGQLVY